MKKELFLPFLLAIFVSASVVSLCSASLIYAQGTTTNSVENRLQEMREKRAQVIQNREQKMDELRQRQEERRDQVIERLATREAQIRERTVSRIKHVFANILNRFNAALGRLDKIAQRIASRIDKLKAKGVNTAGAEAALASAEQKGSAAALAISNAKSQIEAVDASSSSVRDAVHSAVNATRDAKQALKDYHKALVEALRQLKAANALREGTESAN